MRRILQVGKDFKVRRARVKELMSLNLSQLEMEIKLQLIQDLIPLELMHVGDILEEEVKALTGDRGMEYLAMQQLRITILYFFHGG